TLRALRVRLLELTRVVHTAKSTPAKPGIAAVIGEPSVAKAGTAATEAAEPTAVESTEPTAKCRGAFDPDGHECEDRCANQQSASQLLPVVETHGHRFPPDCYLVEAVVWNSTFDVPDGSTGVNTGAAMRGAKSQSLNTALNC